MCTQVLMRVIAHRNLTLGEKSLAALGIWSCTGLSVRCYTNWAYPLFSPFQVSAVKLLFSTLKVEQDHHVECDSVCYDQFVMRHGCLTGSSSRVWQCMLSSVCYETWMTSHCLSHSQAPVNGLGCFYLGIVFLTFPPSPWFFTIWIHKKIPVFLIYVLQISMCFTLDLLLTQV